MKRQAPGAALFELGRVFDGSEFASMALVMTGSKSGGNWAERAKIFDFYDLKGVLEALADALGMNVRCTADQAAPSWLHPGQCAKVKLGPMKGFIGALHPALAKGLEARESVYVLELQGLASDALVKTARFIEISSLPHVERDLSCMVDIGFEAVTLLDAINKGGFGHSELNLKDMYMGPPLPEGKKSLTVTLTYLASGQTLTDEEVNRRHEALSQMLQSSLSLEIRG
jgi:phenylalanyl-tRNA synthetase beta chain